MYQKKNHNVQAQHIAVGTIKIEIMEQTDEEQKQVSGIPIRKISKSLIISGDNFATCKQKVKDFIQELEQLEDKYNEWNC